MDKAATCTHNGILLSRKKELDFAICKWIDLEGIMFGEVSQRQTDTV